MLLYGNVNTDNECTSSGRLALILCTDSEVR